MRPPFIALDAAIVDLDGTMIDTLGDFAVALNRMLGELGLPAIEARAIEPMVGRGSEHLIRAVLEHVQAPAALYEAAWQSYQRHYLAINGDYSAVYPGVIQGLEALQAAGLRLVCLTNKPAAFAQPLLQAKGLAGFFEAVFGGDAFERKKPDPLPLLKSCEALGSSPGSHADDRRLEQRREGRACRGLPGVAGDLWLQPRRADWRRGCGRFSRLAGRAARLDQAGLPSSASLSFQSAGLGPSQMRSSAL